MSRVKRVTFSPQLTNVKDYNSPYCDPTFMASPDHDAWKQRVAKHYAKIKLNFIEEVSPKILCNCIYTFISSGPRGNISSPFYSLF